MDTQKDWTELRPFLDADGRLTAFPAKQKKKLLALWYLASQIAPGRTYTEPEINALLNEWTRFRDPATLRRELYNKMLLNRTTDCSRYWKADPVPTWAAWIEKYV